MDYNTNNDYMNSSQFALDKYVKANKNVANALQNSLQNFVQQSSYGD